MHGIKKSLQRSTTLFLKSLTPPATNKVPIHPDNLYSGFLERNFHATPSVNRICYIDTSDIILEDSNKIFNNENNEFNLLQLPQESKSFEILNQQLQNTQNKLNDSRSVLFNRCQTGDLHNENQMQLIKNHTQQLKRQKIKDLIQRILKLEQTIKTLQNEIDVLTKQEAPVNKNEILAKYQAMEEISEQILELKKTNFNSPDFIEESETIKQFNATLRK